MRVTFNPAARRELREARDFYEDEREGLGAEFVAAVEDAILLLQTHPEAAPQVAPQVRLHVIKRFPYSIIYSRLQKNHLGILAIAHQSRRPFYWIGRLS